MIRYLFITVFAFSFLNSMSQSEDSAKFVQYFYSSGELSSEGNMIKDKPIGYWKSYYKNGNLKTEGNRVDDLLDGEWKFYRESGDIKLIINYKTGKKDGDRISYDEDGNIQKIEEYKEDKKEGFTRIFYNSDKLKKIVPFENNREQGIGFEYGTDGRILTLLTYKSGVLVKEQFINRYDDQNNKKGTWMSFYDNLQRSEEGMYNKDLKHGYWKYYKRNGNLLRIEKWVNGVLIPEDEVAGKLEMKRIKDPNTGKIVSSGPYRNGKKEGIHELYDEEGQVVKASIYSNDKLLAEGDYDEKGRKQGLWKYYYETGELKEKGEYKDDLKTKLWEYYFLDGSIEQMGRYVKDKPEGVWKWYFPNRELRLEEEYVSGLEEGLSTEYSDSGLVVATGEYIEGFKEGSWVYTIGNIKEEGSYYEGQKQGKWISTYVDNGKKAFEGSYINGVKDGKHNYFYPSGNIKRRELYVNDVKEGIWEFFDNNGSLYLTIEYKAGKEVKYNGQKISYGRRVDRQLEEEE